MLHLVTSHCEQLQPLHVITYIRYWCRQSASAAAGAGVPQWKVQALGCWSSDCSKCYIRLHSTETNGVARAIARMPL